MASELSFLLAVLFLCIACSIIILVFLFVTDLIHNSGRPPIAGTIFDLLRHFDNIFDFFVRKAQKHRTFRLIVRPSRSECYTADPANVEHILKNNFKNYTKGRYNYEIMFDLFGNGIFAVDGQKWRSQRKLASHEFSARILRDFSTSVFRSNAAKLAQKLSGTADAGTAVDIQDLLMRTTLDSIFEVGFGVNLRTLSGADALGARFSAAFDDANRAIFHRYADLLWQVKRFCGVGWEGKLKRDLKIIDDFVFQLIRRKRELMKSGAERNKEDILSRFIMASQEEPETMTDRYLRDIILNFLIAGKDTSANTLTWFFYMLCKHPDVQEKIVLEIREVTVASKDDDINGFASSLTEDVLDKMNYLHATLAETLRLYPAVPADGKTAEEDDVLPDGFKIKKGDGITYVAYAMGRMTDIWGENAQDFRPERWMESGKFQSESPFKFVAFHAGPRLCLGKEFAYRQMKILAAVLLHFLRFKLGDESFVAKYRTMFTLHMDEGLHLLAFRRS